MLNARGFSAPAGQAGDRTAAAMHVHIWLVKVLFRSGALLLENVKFSHVLNVRVWPLLARFRRPFGSHLGCVYTYPDIRISGYPDVRDPDIFGAFTRVGSKRFRRLHVSRHPDALYAAFSLSVGEIRMCFFLVKLHAFKLSFIFPIFLLIFVGWTTRSKFCLVSPVIDYKTQR